MKTLVMIIMFACVPAFVHAVPPSPPDEADLIKRSDLIVIVTVTNVTEHFVGKRDHRSLKQAADATIERVLKGKTPRALHLAFEEYLNISCHPAGLSRGKFLLFLRWDGDGYVRTDAWYSQAAITTNQVHLLLNPPVDLNMAINRIEKIVQSN